MTVTIGINGFGRIGRSVTRIVAATPHSGISIAAVNDLASTEKMAYGLRRDSIRGAFPGTVTARADHLVVNDHAIRAFHHERPGTHSVGRRRGRRRHRGHRPVPGRHARPAPTSPTAAPARS